MFVYDFLPFDSNALDPNTSTQRTPVSSCTSPSPSPRTSTLPLRLLPPQKLIQHAHPLLQRDQPRIQLLAHPRLVVPELRVKVLAVRRGAHGGGEDGLDDEGVVRLEGAAVGVAEGDAQLVGRVAEVLAQRLRGEVQAARQPEQALGRRVRFRLELAADEVLERGAVEGGGEVAGADFLAPGEGGVSDGEFSHRIHRVAWGWFRLTVMLPVMSLLTGLNAALPNTSKSRVRASEASRNSGVEMPLSLLSSMGTSAKERLLSKNVPPGGAAAMVDGCLVRRFEWWFTMTVKESSRRSTRYVPAV